MVEKKSDNIGKLIRELISERGMTQLDVAQKLGYKTQSGVSERLRNEPRIGSVIKILNVIGCELVIRDKDSGKEWSIANEPTPTPGDAQ